MSWRRFAIGVTLVVAVLLLCALLMLPRVIEQALPELMTELTGQRVAIEDVSISLFPPGASVSRLMIGPNAAPALRTENFEIDLDGVALLKGQIHIDAARAALIRLDPNGWQSGTSDEPLDLSAVESWLPETVQIQRLEVFHGAPLLLNIRDFSLLKDAEDLRMLRWTQEGVLSPLDVSVAFSSPQQLLETRRGTIRFEVAQASQPDQVLAAEVAVEPTATGGVEQVMQFEGQAITGTWTYTTDDLFAWPETSLLKLEVLDVNRMQNLISEIMPVVEAPPVGPQQDWLRSPLPEITLPPHKMDVQVDQIFLGNELVYNLFTRLTAQQADAGAATEIRLHDLSAVLPGADLTGNLSITLNTQWQIGIALQATSQGGPVSGLEKANLLWHNGHVDLATQGAMPIQLLENARGSIAAEGLFFAGEALPARIRADFSSDAGLLGTDALEVQIGDSSVTGALWTDSERRSLSARLSSPLLDLDAMSSAAPDENQEPFNLAIPDFSWLPAELPIEIEFAGETLQVGGLRLKDLVLGFHNQNDRARLDLAFTAGLQGQVKLQFDAQQITDGTALVVDLSASDVDLQQFGSGAPAKVGSARVHLAGRVSNPSSAVSDLTGELAFQLTSERLSEALVFSARPSLEVLQGNVASVTLDNIDMRIGKATHTRGQVRVGIPEFGIVGRLDTTSLNLDKLMRPMAGEAAASAADAEPAEIVPLLQMLPSVDLQLLLG